MFGNFSCGIHRQKTKTKKKKKKKAQNKEKRKEKSIVMKRRTESLTTDELDL
jgi:hypothetical protein